jgi:SAM-dependent methyltransferase
MDREIILKATRDYYDEKLRQHGATHLGIDWNSKEGAIIRYEQLLKIINTADNFSLLDYGCGYGLMYDYLRTKQQNFKYTGFDISEEMINEAKSRHSQVGWASKEKDLKVHDFVVASGIFNVKQNCLENEWKSYILETLGRMHDLSEKGFSFNLLTNYSDKHLMKKDLFYGDPAFFFDYCKRNFSKNVALLHDYPLYEFCILVRKNIDNG